MYLMLYAHVIYQMEVFERRKCSPLNNQIGQLTLPAYYDTQDPSFL